MADHRRIDRIAGDALTTAVTQPLPQLAQEIVVGHQNHPRAMRCLSKRQTSTASSVRRQADSSFDQVIESIDWGRVNSDQAQRASTDDQIRL